LLSDQDGRPYGARHPDRFGVMAMPAAWDSTGNGCFVVSEGASVFRFDFGKETPAPEFGRRQATFDGQAPCAMPMSGWKKVE
jgi:hypothetical protein